MLVGEILTESPRITVFDYNETEVNEKEVESVDGYLPFVDKSSVTWINISSLQDVELIRSMAESVGLHPLVLEDILDTDHRPKLEDYGDYIYTVLKMIRLNESGDEMITEQVSLVLGKGFVLSFQERDGDVFEPIRDRIRAAKGRIRKMGADYLAHSLLDAIVDGYFVVLENRAEQIEMLEDELISFPSPKTLQGLYRLKRDGLFLRRSIWPVRELAASLERIESPLVSESLHAYLRDLYDHTIQAIDTTETFRDMLSGMLDTYLSSQSNRMNEVMKVLTIIATIFIPLSFVAGVYGMNFKFMPELGWRWGYFAALGVMAAVALGMLVFIKRRKWL